MFDANIGPGEPFWRETGDGHGTTLAVTNAALLAIGIERGVVQTMAAVRGHAKPEPAPDPKLPAPRTGTKQTLLIAMLQATGGATMDKIIAATCRQAHTARVAMSGALGKNLGLVGPIAYLCRSGCSFRPPFVRKPRGFSSRGLSVCGGGYRSR